MKDEKEYYSLLESLSKDLPKRKDGKIDYTHAKKAAILTIFIKYQDEILLLKRSNDVLTYKGKWNTVAGYLDEIKPIHETIFEELDEELRIQSNDIENINIADSFCFKDKILDMSWIVFPALVKLSKKPDIILNWEHTEYRWINPLDIDHFDTVPNAKKSLILSLLNF